MSCDRCGSNDLRVINKQMSPDFTVIKFTWKCNVCDAVFERDYAK